MAAPAVSAHPSPTRKRSPTMIRPELPADNKLTLSVDETARLLGVSPGLVYELVRRNQLTALRLGRRILIPRHAVQALVGQPDAGTEDQATTR